MVTESAFCSTHRLHMARDVTIGAEFGVAGHPASATAESQSW